MAAVASSCRRPWNKSWNGQPENSGAISASGAICRVICAGHATDAREQASRDASLAPVSHKRLRPCSGHTLARGRDVWQNEHLLLYGGASRPRSQALPPLGRGAARVVPVPVLVLRVHLVELVVPVSAAEVVLEVPLVLIVVALRVLIGEPHGDSPQGGAALRARLEPAEPPVS
jgi:hypothetical protein